MTKAAFRKYQRLYRKRKRSRCECGNLAGVKRKTEWICERCAKLEEQREEAERRKARPDSRVERRKWLSAGLPTQDFTDEVLRRKTSQSV